MRALKSTPPTPSFPCVLTFLDLWVCGVYFLIYYQDRSTHPYHHQRKFSYRITIYIQYIQGIQEPDQMNLLILLLFSILPTHAQNATCYFLDGSVAASDVPCTSDATTNCCNKNDICMSNGLCYLQGSHGMALSRGSCTDKSWGARCFAPCCMFLSFFFLRYSP
ncbi:hypothetical protein BDV37DRAFT_169354 [Aspergillus pseudonomiae]|uniref:Uncharacterized protein n=1 Tax=Aspergillus pseudonomiae TaxID=1506151 RepID=A0A5N7D5S1_9EURO|nr:uncharacterized protein BDV37DRAFT_169354 [Aspergillus pseudonomiae]KAE8401752.1 hypothetical protein BDV37DRAFT_169354 [Aspergillus pseudonomiae]